MFIYFWFGIFSSMFQETTLSLGQSVTKTLFYLCKLLHIEKLWLFATSCRRLMLTPLSGDSPTTQSCQKIKRWREDTRGGVKSWAEQTHPLLWRILEICPGCAGCKAATWVCESRWERCLHAVTTERLIYASGDTRQWGKVVKSANLERNWQDRSYS